MSLARKLALGILSPLFITLLLVTALDVGFVRTATHPATVKKIIASSGVYNSVLPSLLQQTKTIETSAGNLSATDPQVVKAANATVTPKYIQANTEAAIDNIYQWLNGKIVQPDFKFDLADLQGNFADQLAAAAQQRLSGLPACTSQAQFDSSNPLNATCLPPGVTPASAAAQLKASVAQSQDFLTNTNLSADTFKTQSPFCGKTAESGEFQCTTAEVNHSFFSSHNQIPKYYQQAKNTPLILSILTVLTGVGIIVFSRTWQVGLRHVGINLAVIGLLMLLVSYFLNHEVVTKLAPRIDFGNNAILQRDTRDLAVNLTQQVDKNYWYFGGLYTAIGVVSVTGAEIFRRRNLKPTPSKPTTTSSAPVNIDKRR